MIQATIGMQETVASMPHEVAGSVFTSGVGMHQVNNEIAPLRLDYFGLKTWRPQRCGAKFIESGLGTLSLSLGRVGIDSSVTMRA